MDAISHYFGLAIVVAMLGVMLNWQYSRSRSMLEGWAKQNEYELLNSDYRYLRKGPFTWTSSKNQTVYYVTVRDKQNRVRSGWVCCGGWWRGLYANRAEVRWDDKHE